MRRILMIAAIAVTTLGAGQVAMANDRPDGPPPACRAQDRNCPAKPEAGAQKGDHHKPRGEDARPGKDRRDPPRDARRDARHDDRRDAHQPPAQDRRHAEARGDAPEHGAKAPQQQPRKGGPKVGDSARDAKPFHPRQDSGYPAPGKGQEYRTVKDRVVLVDKKSDRILALPHK